MVRESQSACTRLTEQLRGEIWRVNFYRFCRLLELAAPDAPLLGSTSHPGNDPVRFRPWPGMGFPVSELRVVEDDEKDPDAPLSVRTTFLGIYGVDSPLPTHYLDDIATRREGVEAVTAFLDMFSHRITTQYYRIWRKYAYPATFEAGGTDATSQCLLGLVGLGIPGTAGRIATPVSRFLALLGNMRLPTRNAEGICALVSLLAPQTQTTVSDYEVVHVPVAVRSGLGQANRVMLSARPVLGHTTPEARSRVRVTLSTTNREEASGWLPGGTLHTDLLVLLRVYLGYRSDVRLQLRVPLSLLPEPRLDPDRARRVRLGQTGVLGRQESKSPPPRDITVNTGRYEGLCMAARHPASDGQYRFDQETP